MDAIANVIRIEPANRPTALPPAQGEMRTLMRRALVAEAQAVTDFAQGSLAECEAAAELIYRSKGPLIVAGLGKSGHIAAKISATFRSLGKPSVFLHPAEASHGDLGLIHPESVVLILSNSGETRELSDLIHYCQVHRNRVIALTGNGQSTLGLASDVAIVYGRLPEVCVNGLAPTTSTTVSLAIGDALAVAVSRWLKAAPEDFRRYHPGGTLGSRLLKVSQVMRVGDAVPLVQAKAPMCEVAVIMSEKALGTAVIVENGRLRGIITDGDMRRNMRRLWSLKAEDVATPHPVTVRESALVCEATELMTRRRITVCGVESEQGHFVGLLALHDCVRATAV